MNVPTFVTPGDGFFPPRSLGQRQPTGPRVGRPMRTAYTALATVIGILVLWSAEAPLDSAAVASGILRAEGGGRRVVQHLEGGIVRKILVQEGDMVHAGQPLVILDGTQSGAQDAALQASYDALLAQEARLAAERSGAGTVTYPTELTSRASEPGVREIIAASDSVFRAKRQALQQQLSILEQRIGQAAADLGSTGGQAASLNAQGALIDQEAKSVETLVNEGLERKSRLLALQRQSASIAGQRSQVSGNAAHIRESIAETRAQMAFLRGQQVNDNAVQERDVQASLAEAREKLTVSRDIDKRRQVVAPVDGRIVNLRIITPGGVLAAGQPVLDIVPTHEQTVIVARLKATDIDVVNSGLQAEIRLTPYKARVMPLLRGTVRNVSADATFDEKTNGLYYETEILLDPKQLKELKNIKLVSGMPAEVFIKLGSRSLLQYLTQPMIDSFHRAFREP